MVFFIFIQILIKHSASKQWKTLIRRSDLGLHYLLSPTKRTLGSGLKLKVRTKKNSYFSTKTYLVGTQKNCLQGSSKDGPYPFYEKPINVLLKWTLFLAGPHIQAIQISCQLCSNVDIKDSWGPSNFAKGS